MDTENTSSLPHVLVVEDDQSITRMLRFSLKAGGFGITEVSTGAEALGHLNNAAPEAVVLDLGLSDGDASVVLDRLRQQPGRSPVWVCISSLDQQEASDEHGPLGRHFLGKPFDPWELVGILKAMLSGAAHSEHQSPWPGVNDTASPGLYRTDHARRKGKEFQ